MILNAYSMNKHIGFLIGDLFIRDDELIYILSSDVKLQTNGYRNGKVTRNGFTDTRGDRYLSLRKYLVTDKYSNLQFLLDSENISQNGVLLLRVLNAQDCIWKPYNLVLDSLLDEYISMNDITNVYSIIVDGELAGFIATDTDFYDKRSTSVRVLLFETIRKNKGYGTRVIRYMLKFKSIEGLSLVSSFDFWSSFDARFKDNYFKIERKRGVSSYGRQW